MREQRGLLQAWATAATGFDRDAVIGAAAFTMLNALRQAHARHIDAEAQMEEMFDEMRRSLRDRHYNPDGTRNDRKVVMPPMGKLFPHLDGLSGELLDRFVQGRSLRG